jgi:hypothetical protein
MHMIQNSLGNLEVFENDLEIDISTFLLTA